MGANTKFSIGVSQIQMLLDMIVQIRKQNKEVPLSNEVQILFL